MMKKVLSIVLLFGLAGCGTPLGIALGVVGSSTVSFLSTSVQDDIAQAAVWRGKQQEIVNECKTMLMQQVRALEDEKFNKMKGLCDQVLLFHEKQQPKLLAERLAARYRNYKEGKAPEEKPK